ncbi:hypothetical protein [Flagellimonas pacifica]|uniref:Isoleucyl-tRNA synthetase n=1 Tax=Flagellimonas pacifica TaxID=1247520 RepID=A0A285MDG0_9FLAO|nr:hypothetical protein [Allomuricauda parva]SNY95224.1 hypothetical protein SAMN06265377_0890 [Allomuricauda parva]
MKFKLKHLTILALLASVSSIVYGFAIKKDNLSLANKFIGGGTAGLFLVTMPLFLFKESKGKDMKDYMLTKENIKKMQGKERENAENQ